MKLSCRLAAMTDAELLWHWANDPNTRENALNKASIPFADHQAWLGKKLASNNAKIFIFSEGDVPVGQVRFDIEDGVAEIDIAVAPPHRGRGYGKVMLVQAIASLRAEGHEGVRMR